jgi:nitric oxide reductase NorE protein
VPVSAGRRSSSTNRSSGSVSWAGNGAHKSEFFQLYFLLTGIHLLHVIAACLVVLYLWKKAATVRMAPTVLQARFFENGASYWHLVDLIWMVLFALFYLVR